MKTFSNNEKSTAIVQNRLKNGKIYPEMRISRSLSIISTQKHRAQVYEYKIFKNYAYTMLVGGVAQWLGCRSVAGGLSLIYA